MLRRAQALVAALGRTLGPLVLGLALLFGAPAASAADHGIPQAVMKPAPAEWVRPTVPEPAAGWVTETGLYGDVHSTWGDKATARRLASHLATSLPALAKRIGVYPGATIEVYVVESEADFHRMQPGQTPDWADGTAWPDASLIFLKSPSIRPGDASPLETVLDHELVHVLLGQAFGGRPVPHWLQEGYAQFYAGEAFERSLSMARNEYGLAPMPLFELTRSFPKDALHAQLAYAESADFVTWIARRSGEAALRTLVTDLAEGRSVNDAITRATGLSMDKANEAWLGTVPTSNAWYRWLTNTNVLWGALGVLMAVGAWRRRQHAKAKLARWEAEDAARAAALLERQAAAWAQAEESGLQPWVAPGLPIYRPRRVEPDPRWN